MAIVLTDEFNKIANPPHCARCGKTCFVRPEDELWIVDEIAFKPLCDSCAEATAPKLVVARKAYYHKHLLPQGSLT